MTSATRISTKQGVLWRLSAWTDGSVATEPFGFVIGVSRVKDCSVSIAEQAIELRDILLLCEEREFGDACQAYNRVLKMGLASSVERERVALSFLERI